jgi:DNA-binding Lrp family transcriptional regulator
LSIAILDSNIQNMRTAPPILAPIFRSDGQARLLAVALFDGELSLSDLAERAGVSYPSAHREVARLLDAGILTERTIGRSRLIRANEASPLVSPLTEILRIIAGPVPLLRRELSAIPGIDAAFIYGSFAARTLDVAGATPNDIDLMVIGEPDVTAVYDACTRVEDLVHRPVNPTILTSAEFNKASGFLDNVRSAPAVPVIGPLPWH